jgi:2-hydroxyacyl-CoA lyase 1
LNKKVRKNKLSVKLSGKKKNNPMQYYDSLSIIESIIPKDTILINEGYNTMDVGRTVFSHDLPKKRLDAGTLGTMGVGIPFCIAARLVHPKKTVVGILGDSAFGFSCMEIESAIRHNLPFICIVINNAGIMYGTEEYPKDSHKGKVAPTSYRPKTRYDKLATAFGGKGYLV